MRPNHSFKRTASPPLNSNVRPQQYTALETAEKVEFGFLLSFHVLACQQKRAACHLSRCYSALQQTSSCKAHVTSTLGASATGLERKPTVCVLSSFEFSQLGRCKSLNAICGPKCCSAIAGAAAIFKWSGISRSTT